MRHELFWLDDIIEATTTIATFISGYTYEAFLDDIKTQAAVLQQLTVIGEAAGRLSPELRDRSPGVDWKSIVGFRNRAVHEYFGLDWKVVWDSASVDVPLLRKQILEIVTREANEQ